MSKEKIDEHRLKVFEKNRDQEIKYVYYLVALCVSSLGYAVFRTAGHPLNNWLILWAASMLCWGVSAFLGLTYLSDDIKFNDTLGVYHMLRSNAQNDLDADARNIINRIIADYEVKNDSKYTKLKRLVEWQRWLFLCGVVVFIFWHLTEMYHSK